MKLNVLDRLSLINILPREGNFLTLTIAKDITKKVGILQDEAKEIGIVFGEKNVSWKPDAPEKDVEFSDSELGVIKKQLKKLDTEGKLTMELLETYNKFGADDE